MAITDSTLYTSVFTEIRNKIVAKAPYVTNSTTGATTLASIKAVFNDETPVRPQIVIEPVSKSESSFKFSSTEGKKFINITIECYYKNTLGIDQLAEQVEEALKVNDISGIDLVGITSDYALNLDNEDKYHLKTLTASYDRE